MAPRAARQADSELQELAARAAEARPEEAAAAGRLDAVRADAARRRAELDSLAARRAALEERLAGRPAGGGPAGREAVGEGDPELGELAGQVPRVHARARI